MVFFFLKCSLCCFFPRGEQVHVLCGTEELMPAIGNSVPSPSLLTLLISQLDSTLQNMRKIHADDLLDDSFDFNEGVFDFCYKTHFISISDDGKIWSWILCVKRDEEDSNPQTNEDLLENQDLQPNLSFEVYDRNVKTCFGIIFHLLDFYVLRKLHSSIQISLVGQLQLLSSKVTVLAVPTPSMTATLAREFHRIVYIRRKWKITQVNG